MNPPPPPLPSAADPVISPLFRDPLKSVVAIFRINTLTPVLTVGSDVNQVYRPKQRTGEARRGVCVWESRRAETLWWFIQA